LQDTGLHHYHIATLFESLASLTDIDQKQYIVPAADERHLASVPLSGRIGLFWPHRQVAFRSGSQRFKRPYFIFCGEYFTNPVCMTFPLALWLPLFSHTFLVGNSRAEFSLSLGNYDDRFSGRATISTGSRFLGRRFSFDRGTGKNPTSPNGRGELAQRQTSYHRASPFISLGFCGSRIRWAFHKSGMG
jgi:hypothetical protein